MFRRRYLALAGSMAVAGCSGASDGGDGGGGDGSTPTATPEPTTTPEPTPTDSPTPTDAPTATASPTPTTNYSVDRAELVVNQGQYTTDRGAIVEVTNTADTVGWGWELSVAFLNDSDTVLTTSSARLLWLAPDATWRAHVNYLGTDESVASVSATVASVTPTTIAEVPTGGTPDGVTMLEHELQAGGEMEGPQVVGRLRNDHEETLPYLQSLVQFSDGTFQRGAGFDNVSDLPAGSAWKYTVGYNPAMIEDGSEISDYGVLASTNV